MDDEIEALEGQIELLSVDIDGKNGELLGLQTQGIRACADADDITADGLAQIKFGVISFSYFFLNQLVTFFIVIDRWSLTKRAPC